MVTAGTQTYRARYTKLRQINNVTWLGRKITADGWNIADTKCRMAQT